MYYTVQDVSRANFDRQKNLHGIKLYKIKMNSYLVNSLCIILITYNIIKFLMINLRHHFP